MGAITDILDNFGKDTVSIIKQNLSSTGTNASGETSNSLDSVMPSDTRVKVTGKQFIYTVETGRKPTKNGNAGGKTLLEQIKKWVIIRGIPEGAAYGITKKIHEQGTALFRKGGRTDIITPAISEDRLNKLTSDVANAALEDVVVKIDTDGKGRKI